MYASRVFAGRCGQTGGALGRTGAPEFTDDWGEYQDEAWREGGLQPKEEAAFRRLQAAIRAHGARQNLQAGIGAPGSHEVVVEEEISDEDDKTEGGGGGGWHGNDEGGGGPREDETKGTDYGSEEWAEGLAESLAGAEDSLAVRQVENAYALRLRRRAGIAREELLAELTKGDDPRMRIYNPRRVFLDQRCDTWKTDFLPERGAEEGPHGEEGGRTDKAFVDSIRRDLYTEVHRFGEKIKSTSNEQDVCAWFADTERSMRRICEEAM
jgi:hypothetical protein